jgi:hypothetical protein
MGGAGRRGLGTSSRTRSEIPGSETTTSESASESISFFTRAKSECGNSTGRKVLSSVTGW